MGFLSPCLGLVHGNIVDENIHIIETGKDEFKEQIVDFGQSYHIAAPAIVFKAISKGLHLHDDFI